MKWRKILAAGMGLVLAAGLISGCGGQKKETGNGKKDNQEKAMGRLYRMEKPLWAHIKRMESSICILQEAARIQM